MMNRVESAVRSGPARRADGAANRSTAPVVGLHHSLGNAALLRLLQARLSVSQPDDPYEQEAERVADAVTRTPAPMPNPATDPAGDRAPVQVRCACPACAPELERRARPEEEELLQTRAPAPVDSIQRQAPLEEDEPPLAAKAAAGTLAREALPEEEPLARRAAGIDADGTVSDEVATALAGLAGRGQPLSEPVRADLEPRFGADFGAVRVHTDASAHDLARAVHAEAFTLGTDVVFGAGRYAPETDSGRHLLAHELTHVVQQRPGATLQRFSTEDCSTSEKAKLTDAYDHAKVMLRHAIARLTAAPVTAATRRHFANHFGAYADWRRSIVVWHLRRDLSLLAGGDITFECESACDGERGYTYWVLGDIHLCPAWFSDTRLNHRAETLIHELHHWDPARGQLDLGYHDEQQDADTVWPVAVNNADAYSMLVLDLYQGP